MIWRLPEIGQKTGQLDAANFYVRHGGYGSSELVQTGMVGFDASVLADTGPNVDNGHRTLGFDTTR
jgi:hypothetical protein